MKSFERRTDQESVRSDWQVVGDYLRQAILEVAQEQGAEVVDEALKRAESDQVLPNPAALEYLETIQPGSADAVISRAEQLQSDHLAK